MRTPISKNLYTHTPSLAIAFFSLHTHFPVSLLVPVNIVTAEADLGMQSLYSTEK